MAKKDVPKKKAVAKKRAAPNKRVSLKRLRMAVPPATLAAPLPGGGSPEVLDRLWGVVTGRREASPETSHSARLLARGTAKIAQKFGEEAVECLIEAVAGNPAALIAESADVLYHLIVMWVDAGVRPEAVWAELERREGVSGIAEKAGRVKAVPLRLGAGTRKIP
jgi:phosphoribosyl-ATP pyrophosphohydrolase